MSDMTHKMWSQWKDFRLNEKKGDHEGQMAKSQLKRSVKLARMNYEIIDGMKKDEDGEVELPAWLQSALTIALENLQSVHTYLDGKSGLDEYSGAGGYVPGSMSGKGGFNPAKMKFSSPEAKPCAFNLLNLLELNAFSFASPTLPSDLGTDLPFAVLPKIVIVIFICFSDDVKSPPINFISNIS